MDLEIYQDIEMGANITGTTIAGRLNNLVYRDKSFKVGALFTFPLNIWISGGQIIERFEVIPLDPEGFQLKSSDFPSENNFELIFYVIEPKINIINNYN
jgi:hypothetical protein